MIRYALVSAIAGMAIASSATAAIVINEVDYDNIGTDTAEFIELFNPDATAQDLTGLSLVLFNGTSVYSTNGTFALSGSIPAGGYYVFGNVTPTNFDPTVNTDLIQNGSIDGFGIYSGNAPTTATATNLVVGVVYEGRGGFPVEFELITVDDSTSVAGSLQRDPSATSTFVLSNPPTPGQLNVVPEPTSLALLGLGGLALAVRRRHR